MRNKRVKGRIGKRIVTGLLTTVMAISGAFVLPGEVKAAGRTDGVYYATDYHMSDYWKADGTGTAPTKAGYVFGGWYQKNGDETYTPVTTLTEGAVAKMVPDYVLSVKSQLEYGAKAGDGASSIRLVTSVDSTDYQKVGAEILINNKKAFPAEEKTKVYAGIKVRNSEENVQTYTPQNVFGVVSKFFTVWKLTGIADAHDSKIIYVRPYWVTMDGTKVYGLAKYVHIEDGYMGYVSVPVNLTAGEGVAAGVIQMKYDTDTFEFYGFENGHVFPNEMEGHDDAAKGIIKIVGNVDNKTDATADGLYANVRFKVKNAASLYEADGITRIFQTFFVTGQDFSNWAETTVSNITGDIQY